MSSVLVIQNSKWEESGTLGDLLKSDGFKLRTIIAKKEKIPSNDFDFVLILGAQESANDNLEYLIEEQKLIRKCVKNSIPVLGICLGSQLIAKAFGAKVYPAQKKEIGFYHDVESESNSKLFFGIKNPFTVFHWHGDTFELPKNSIRLAHSKNFINQAFQIGTAIGVQFHLEVDEKIIRLWLDKAEEELKKISYIDSDKIRKEINESMKEVENTMKIFYHNFKSTFNL